MTRPRQGQEVVSTAMIPDRPLWPPPPPPPSGASASRCHHVSGQSWCNRKAGHRKPHRYELRPISDDELVRKIFGIYETVHPGSRNLIGWVIPAAVRDRLVEMARRNISRDAVFAFNPDKPPAPGPDQLLGRPVRVSGSAILLEVLRPTIRSEAT